MANETLVAPLMRVRLFQGLSTAQLTQIARRAERIIYRDGAVITEEGDTADAAILIVAGETERVNAGIREAIEPGSLVGEMAMLIDHIYGSTVVARGPVRALRLTRSAMHELMTEDRALSEHMVARISSRLSAMLEDLRAVDGTLADVQTRLNPAPLPAVAAPDARYLSHAVH
jgi:CRP-like cAMP-binding protein